MDAFKRLKRHSVIVYVNDKDKNRWDILSPPVFGAMYGKNMGITYPKAVISSPDQLHVYANMNYKQLEESSQYSRVSKITKKAVQGNLPEVKPVFDLNWAVKGSEGSLTGSFVKLVDNKRLYLKIKGKEYGNNIEEFGTGAQIYARHLAGVGAEVKPTVSDTGSEENDDTEIVETWESANNNKTIKASFVSLKDDAITLKMENGKTVKFSMSKLSEKSQKRAKELKTR